VYTTAICLAWLVVGLLTQQPASSSTASTSLDYEVFKAKIQPIFLAKRPGHPAPFAAALAREHDLDR
jgi:hypothetical protein